MDKVDTIHGGKLENVGPDGVRYYTHMADIFKDGERYHVHEYFNCGPLGTLGRTRTVATLEEARKLANEWIKEG